MHGHGGVLLEHYKALGLHLDLRPEDRFFWFSSTSWIMWNMLIGGLLHGATVVLYDGSPLYPDRSAQWELVADHSVTFFGTGAAYVSSCCRADLQPNNSYDLSKLRGIGVTGSPLPADAFRWVYNAVSSDIWLTSISGGSDVATGFVMGAPTLPVYVGELQCRALGVAMEAWDENSEPQIGTVGELVITRPMPSMPVFFWGDKDGSRYYNSYFDTFPGVWRHGDFVTVTTRGTAVIHGRSDSTINRQGIRMGSSYLYDVIERLPEIADSLVIGAELEDGGYYMPLFVVLASGFQLTDELKTRINEAIRTGASPRHVPDEIVEAPGIPRTLTGKKIEVPIKRIFQGHSDDADLNPENLDRPELADFYSTFSAQFRLRHI